MLPAGCAHAHIISAVRRLVLRLEAFERPRPDLRGQPPACERQPVDPVAVVADEAIAAADTLLLTVPNTLGVDYNAHVIESILKFVAPPLGWR